MKNDELGNKILVCGLLILFVLVIGFYFKVKVESPTTTREYRYETTTTILKPKPTTDFLTFHHSWKYGSYEFSYKSQISKEEYEYYRKLPRSSDLAVYVNDPYDDDDLKAIADRLKNEAEENEFNVVSFVASFVQQLPYSSDDVWTQHDEYPRYPLETLMDWGGDCEDTSILTASLIEALGYDAVLLEFKTHVAVGVWSKDVSGGAYVEYNGKKYFYLETTGEGWKIGDIPKSYKGQEVKIIDV